MLPPNHEPGERSAARSSVQGPGAMHGRFIFFRTYVLSGSPFQRRLFLRAAMRKLLPVSVQRIVPFLFRPRYARNGRPRKSSYPPYLRMKELMKPVSRRRNDSGLTFTRGMVSVVLPVYNQGRYLRQSVESVLAQEYDRYELIIVDDGSTDATPEVLGKYAGEKRVSVIRQRHAGLPRALSAGFRAAGGEFRTWTSADNIMKPQQIAVQVAFLEKFDDIDMVYSNYELIDDGGAPLSGSSYNALLQFPPGSGILHLPWDYGELNFVPLNFIGPCFLYRTSAAAVVGDYDPAMAGVEDYDYWMRLNAVGRLAHDISPEPLYQYRIHPSSATARMAEGDIAGKLQNAVTRFAERISDPARPEGFPLLLEMDERK